MRILVSNDDGYQADGIIQLAKSLSDIAEVIVVAPVSYTHLTLPTTPYV